MHHRHPSRKPEVNGPPGGKPGAVDHPHSGSAQASTPSARDKLVIRLRHALQHHQEHGEAYRRMAEDARQLGEEEAARLIRGVSEQTSRQAEDLARALAALGSS